MDFKNRAKIYLFVEKLLENPNIIYDDRKKITNLVGSVGTISADNILSHLLSIERKYKRPVGRPQKANKKSKPFSIRFSQNNLKILNQLSNEINISRSEILEKSFNLYKNSGILNEDLKNLFKLD